MSQPQSHLLDVRRINHELPCYNRTPGLGLDSQYDPTIQESQTHRIFSNVPPSDQKLVRPCSKQGGQDATSGTLYKDKRSSMNYYGAELQAGGSPSVKRKQMQYLVLYLTYDPAQSPMISKPARMSVDDHVTSIKVDQGTLLIRPRYHDRHRW